MLFRSWTDHNKKLRMIIYWKRATSNKVGVLFVNDPGGTEKTFLYYSLLKTIRSQGILTLVTANSSVGAKTTKFSLYIISKQSSKTRLLRRARIIIWDEASMAMRFVTETVDRTLRDIMNSFKPLGGNVFVFGGEFF